jgi:hypothetical protein
MVYVLFVHKKSVSKRKVCIIFIQYLKFKKTQKNTFMWIFYVGFLGGFFGWVFIANPAFSLGRMSRVKPSAWPRCLLPPFR